MYHSLADFKLGYQPVLTKYMKTYIKGANITKIQHQNKAIIITTEVLPWSGQYIKLLAALTDLHYSQPHTQLLWWYTTFSSRAVHVVKMFSVDCYDSSAIDFVISSCLRGKLTPGIS